MYNLPKFTSVMNESESAIIRTHYVYAKSLLLLPTEKDR